MSRINFFPQQPAGLQLSFGRLSPNLCRSRTYTSVMPVPQGELWPFMFPAYGTGDTAMLEIFDSNDNIIATIPNPFAFLPSPTTTDYGWVIYDGTLPILPTGIYYGKFTWTNPLVKNGQLVFYTEYFKVVSDPCCLHQFRYYYTCSTTQILETFMFKFWIDADCFPIYEPETNVTEVELFDGTPYTQQTIFKERWELEYRFFPRYMRPVIDRMNSADVKGILFSTGEIANLTKIEVSLTPAQASECDFIGDIIFYEGTELKSGCCFDPETDEVPQDDCLRFPPSGTCDDCPVPVGIEVIDCTSDSITIRIIGGGPNYDYALGKTLPLTWIPLTPGSNEVTISGLDPCQTIFITVRTNCSPEFSDTIGIQATTKGDDCDIPLIVKTIDEKTQKTIQWTSSVDSVCVWYKEADSETWILATNIGGSSDSFTITGLTPGTAYNVRLQGKCTDACSSESEFTFTNFTTLSSLLTFDVDTTNITCDDGEIIVDNVQDNDGSYTIEIKDSDGIVIGSATDMDLTQPITTEGFYTICVTDDCGTKEQTVFIENEISCGEPPVLSLQDSNEGDWIIALSWTTEPTDQCYEVWLLDKMGQEVFIPTSDPFWNGEIPVPLCGTIVARVRKTFCCDGNCENCELECEWSNVQQKIFLKPNAGGPGSITLPDKP